MRDYLVNDECDSKLKLLRIEVIYFTWSKPNKL